MNVLIKEIVSRIVMVLLTLLAIKIDWKLALIAPPLAFWFFDSILGGRSGIGHDVIKLVLDLLTWVSFVGYLVFSIVLTHRYIEPWYSWLIGIGAWLLFGQLLGFLFPRRWHFERVNKTFE